MKKAIPLSVLFLSGTALLATEPEPQSCTEARTEFKEITFRVGGSGALTAALLEAAAKERTVTGFADFDSLSAVYGLMGIYREGVSSGFFGDRFRLRFPSRSDVAAITGAYQNLPYITGRWGGVEPKREAGVRKKLGYGMLGGALGGLFGASVAESTRPEAEHGTDPTGVDAFAYVFLGLMGGNVVGSAAGVSAAGEGMGFPAHLAGSALLGVGVPWAALAHFGWNDGGAIALLGVIAGPVIGATLASELGDRFPPPGESKNSRFSLGLAPNFQRGLSAFATFHL